MMPSRDSDSANAYSRRNALRCMLSFLRRGAAETTAFSSSRPDLTISLRLYAIVLVTAALLISPCRAADDLVTLNFVNADIDAVVKAVSEMTGRNFLLDPRVKGVINIVSARPVPRSLVYPTLLSALRLQGFTAVEAEGITKIVPEADAKQQASTVVRPGTGMGGDRVARPGEGLKSGRR